MKLTTFRRISRKKKFFRFLTTICTMSARSASTSLRIWEDGYQGFWRILEDFEIFEISKKIENRLWRVYPSGVARGWFYPRKRTFQRRLKKFENKISCFSTLSGRFGVVEFSRCGHIQQNDQNWSKLMKIQHFDGFLTTSVELDDTEPIR